MLSFFLRDFTGAGGLFLISIRVFYLFLPLGTLKDFVPAVDNVNITHPNMPPTRRTRSATVTDHELNIPADLDLHGLFVKDLRSMCGRAKLPTTGVRAALIERLENARQNSSIRTDQNSDEHVVDRDAEGGALQQQFNELRQQVQGLIDRESSDERLLSPGQLTQVQSLIQASINETIEKTASATAQATVNAFTGSSHPAKEPSADKNGSDPPIPVQDLATSSNATTIVPLLPLLNEASASTETTSTNDSVHELPAKLVKEILSGEFMELSKLLPKNFNALKPLHDEPLTLTLENSVIRVNKAKVASITNIEEWTTAFTAYMSVIITREPFRSAELLEYLSLIRYAAKYHRGLGWCVYDNKFRHKAAAKKTLKWSDIDSQLWLKTFTVAPSLMKEEIGVFQSGPSPTTSTFRGNDNRTCHNFNKGFTCARNPCSYAHKCNRPGCGGDHPGFKCPSTHDSEKHQPVPSIGKSHPQEHGARRHNK